MVVQEAEAEEEAEEEDDDDEAASGVKKSRRSTAGKGVPRLGWNDGWAKGAAGAWRSIEKQSAKALALHAKSLLTPRALEFTSEAFAPSPCPSRDLSCFFEPLAPT